jgi:hypothetical protein
VLDVISSEVRPYMLPAVCYVVLILCVMRSVSGLDCAVIHSYSSMLGFLELRTTAMRRCLNLFIAWPC